MTIGCFGQDETLTAQIHNVEDEDVVAIPVGFWVLAPNAVEIGGVRAYRVIRTLTTQEDTLRAGTTVAVDFSQTSLPSPARLRVDPNFSIMEANETNNWGDCTWGWADEDQQGPAESISEDHIRLQQRFRQSAD